MFTLAHVSDLHVSAFGDTLHDRAQLIKRSARIADASEPRFATCWEEGGLARPARASQRKAEVVLVDPEGYSHRVPSARESGGLLDPVERAAGQGVPARGAARGHAGRRHRPARGRWRRCSRRRRTTRTCAACARHGSWTRTPSTRWSSRATAPTTGTAGSSSRRRSASGTSGGSCSSSPATTTSIASPSRAAPARGPRRRAKLARWQEFAGGRGARARALRRVEARLRGRGRRHRGSRLVLPAAARVLPPERRDRARRSSSGCASSRRRPRGSTRAIGSSSSTTTSCRSRTASASARRRRSACASTTLGPSPTPSPRWARRSSCTGTGTSASADRLRVTISSSSPRPRSPSGARAATRRRSGGSSSTSACTSRACASPWRPSSRRTTRGPIRPPGVTLGSRKSSSAGHCQHEAPTMTLDPLRFALPPLRALRGFLAPVRRWSAGDVDLSPAERYRRETELEDAIRTLPSELRTVFELSYWHDLVARRRSRTPSAFRSEPSRLASRGPPRGSATCSCPTAPADGGGWTASLRGGVGAAAGLGRSIRCLGYGGGGWHQPAACCDVGLRSGHDGAVVLFLRVGLDRGDAFARRPPGLGSATASPCRHASS